MNSIREKNGIAVFEIDGRYYVVGVDWARGQVTSVLCSDLPRDGGMWVAGISEKGIRYVGHGTTRAAAMAAFCREARRRAP